MRSKIGKIGWGVAGTLFLVAPLFASGSEKAEAKTDIAATYSWAYAEEASGLLKQIRSLSVQLTEDTHFLELASQRKQLDWRSHAWHLNQIRKHVNAMGKNLRRLGEIQSVIAPWQQKAVERITPNAVALAVHTEEAIAYLNAWQSNTWAPSYTDHVSAMSVHAQEIGSSVAEFLEYAKTSDRVKVLERQIEYNET